MAALFTTYSGWKNKRLPHVQTLEFETAEASSHDATHVRICCFSAQLDRCSMTPRYRDLSAGGEKENPASLTTPHGVP